MKIVPVTTTSNCLKRLNESHSNWQKTLNFSVDRLPIRAVEAKLQRESSSNNRLWPTTYSCILFIVYPIAFAIRNLQFASFPSESNSQFDIDPETVLDNYWKLYQFYFPFKLHSGISNARYLIHLYFLVFDFLLLWISRFPHPGRNLSTKPKITKRNGTIKCSRWTGFRLCKFNDNIEHSVFSIQFIFTQFNIHIPSCTIYDIRIGMKNVA